MKYLFCAFVLLISSAGSSLAQNLVAPVEPVGITTPAADALPPDFGGAAPPTLPATVSRDEQGNTTVRIVRLQAALRVDGTLDGDLYARVLPISHFIQAEPE